MNPTNTSVTSNSTATSQYKQILDYFLKLGYQEGDRVFGVCVPYKKFGGKNWTAILGETNFEDFAQAYNTNSAKNAKKPYLPENPDYLDDTQEYYLKNPRYLDETKQYYLEYQDGLKWLNSLNNDGYSIFVHVNGELTNDRVKSKNIPLKSYFLEWDDKTQDEMCAEIDGWSFRPSMVIPTGNKSFHVYFFTDETEKLNYDTWKTIQYGLIEKNKSDPSIKDLSRNLRLPSFKHPKTGNFVEIKEYNEGAFSSEKLIQEFNIKVKGKEDKNQFSLEESYQFLEENNQNQKDEQNQKNYNFVRKKSAIPETIKENNDKVTNCIYDALEVFGNAGKREPGLAKQGKTKDENGNLKNHYDECVSLLGALKRYLKDDKKAGELMTNYLGDSEDWESKAVGMQYNRCPSLGTLFYIAKAYGYEFPEDHKKINTYRGLLNVIRKNQIPIKYNLRSLSIEYDGQPLTKGLTPAMILSEDYHIETPDNKADQCFYRISRENEYDPIHLELEAIRKNAEEGKIEKVSIDNLSSRYLGTNDSIYDVFFKKFLIALVARIYEPGCKVDTCLILQGGQNAGKSSLLEILAKGNRNHYPDPFYDGFNFDDKKDEIQNLNQSWLIELAEIDFITNKKEASKVKAFLTKKKDKMRLPYARDTEDYPRHNVFAGTTNKDGFLNDPTGSRRFWVIPVAFSRIDLKTLKSERDGILASAIEAYMKGYQWFLTDDEYNLSEENNQQFQIEDTVTNKLEDWLERNTFETTRNGDHKLGKLNHIIEEVFNVEAGQSNPQFERRVKEGLQSLGCVSKSVRNKGKTEKQYVLSEKVLKNAVTSVTSVTNQQNPYTEGDTEVTKNVTNDSYSVTNPVTPEENVTSNQERLQTGYIPKASHTEDCNFVTNVTDKNKSLENKTEDCIDNQVFNEEEVRQDTETFLSEQGLGESLISYVSENVVPTLKNDRPDRGCLKSFDYEGEDYVLHYSEGFRIEAIDVGMPFDLDNEGKTYRREQNK